MAVATRTITGTIADPSGAAWASQNVIFHLLTSLATTSDDAVLKKTYTVTTDGNGQFTATLAVPDSNAWQYRCTLPDGEKFIFNLEAGAATTLEAIIDDANLSATVSASTLSSYLRLSQILDEDDMASDSDVYPATQGSTKAYIDANIVSSGVDTDGSPEANDFPQFTDANTLKGLSASELRSAINVEDGADVTDTANVTAAGAVMDSEVTDLAGVKALDTSTIQSILAEGAFVDGDKTKLDGIEASADVTDTANVTSAGALMTSGGTMSGDVAMADNTIERPVLKDVGEAATTNAASGATETLDIENGNVFDITLSDNCTFTFSNPSASGTACSFTLILRQDGTGSRSVTWPASVDWPGGTAPTISSDAGAVDVYTFLTVDGGTTWLGFTAGQAFASP